MKKNITKSIIGITLFFLPVFYAHAVAPTIIEFQNPIKSDSVAEVMVSFFGILVQIGAVAVTLAIVYAGFLFVVAKGNPEQLNKAKTTLFWTIIGALILLGSQIIASIIENSIKNL